LTRLGEKNFLTK